MTRRELLAMIAIAVAMAIIGLVWLFGPWTLVAAGATLLLISPFIQVDEGA